METKRRMGSRGGSIGLLSGLILAGCLTGCGASGLPVGGNAAYASELTEGGDDTEALKEQLSRYEPFGMTYDAKQNVLTYEGARVRCFEDYYPVTDDGGETYGGIDFFDEKGVVDVCAVRDFSGIVRNADGSYDPGGNVVGLRRCSDEEFAARDIDALKNPPPAETICGELPSREEMEEIAAEYAPFGVTYDAKAGVWYFKGEKVRWFLDVLTSNGEKLSGGGFRGTIRSYWQDDGTADICTVRNFRMQNAEGYGTLTGVKRR